MNMKNQEELGGKVVQAIEAIKDRKDNLYTQTEAVIGARHALVIAEAAAYATGKIDGKNAEIRAQQLGDMTRLQLENLAIYEAAERAAKFQFEIAQYQLEGVKLILRVTELGNVHD